MKKSILSFVVIIAFLVCCVFPGCATNEDVSPSLVSDVSYLEVGTQSFQDAIQVFPVNFDSDTSLLGVQVKVDSATHDVIMQLNTSTNEIAIAERDAEQAAKAYSEVVAYAEAANSDDDAIKTAWKARGEQEEATEGIGSLYDYYSLSMTVTNEDDTLSLVGTRPAGADSVVTWEVSE